QDQVVVGAAGHQVITPFGQRGGQGAGVGHDLVGVVTEGGLAGLVQGDRDGGRGVVMRAALQAGEHRLVQGGGVLCGRHDHGAAGATQGLVGGGDHGRVADRGRVGAPGDQAGDVGDVGHQDRAHLGRDLGEGGEVDGARDRGTTAEDDLRVLAASQVADLVEVHPPGVAPDVV